VTLRKYLVLAGVTIFASVGDSLLSRGMKDVGHISFSRIPDMLLAITDPYIVLGILLLLAFFACYMTALSWADLTYVLPATSLGYVVVAFIGKFILHEQVPATRWIGILLISAGVGFVAGGPARTDARGKEEQAPSPLCEPVSSRLKP
jgi:drug/metabolite transporter (DMT)-like permease